MNLYTFKIKWRKETMGMQSEGRYSITAEYTMLCDWLL